MARCPCKCHDGVIIHGFSNVGYCCGWPNARRKPFPDAGVGTDGKRCDCECHELLLPAHVVPCCAPARADSNLAALTDLDAKSLMAIFVPLAKATS